MFYAGPRQKLKTATVAAQAQTHSLKNKLEISSLQLSQAVAMADALVRLDRSGAGTILLELHHIHSESVARKKTPD